MNVTRAILKGGRINFGPYSTLEIISWQSKQDTCLYMTDAWVEEHGVQNPAIYDCFPKFRPETDANANKRSPGFKVILWVMFSGARRLELRQNKNYGNRPEYQEYIAKVPIILPLVPLYSVARHKWLMA